MYVYQNVNRKLRVTTDTVLRIQARQFLDFLQATIASAHAQMVKKSELITTNLHARPNYLSRPRLNLSTEALSEHFRAVDERARLARLMGVLVPVRRRVIKGIQNIDSFDPERGAAIKHWFLTRLSTATPETSKEVFLFLEEASQLFPLILPASEWLTGNRGTPPVQVEAAEFQGPIGITRAQTLEEGSQRVQLLYNKITASGTLQSSEVSLLRKLLFGF